MKTIEHSVGIDAQEQANRDVILRQLLEGVPVEAEVLRRVEERSRRVTAEIRRLHGEIDVDQLLSEVRVDS
jgi:hypothetical protein